MRNLLFLAVTKAYLCSTKGEVDLDSVEGALQHPLESAAINWKEIAKLQRRGSARLPLQNRLFNSFQQQQSQARQQQLHVQQAKGEHSQERRPESTESNLPRQPVLRRKQPRSLRAKLEERKVPHGPLLEARQRHLSSTLDNEPKLPGKFSGKIRTLKLCLKSSLYQFSGIQ